MDGIYEVLPRMVATECARKFLPREAPPRTIGKMHEAVRQADWKVCLEMGPLLRSHLQTRERDLTKLCCILSLNKTVILSAGRNLIMMP